MKLWFAIALCTGVFIIAGWGLWVASHLIPIKPLFWS
jgi:hypothetical protein